jgi:hypothetical protein
MDARADRRFALVYLVLVAELDRRGRLTRGPRASAVLPGACAEVGCVWTGRLDRNWVSDELDKVKAVHGEYIAESYERWRLFGLPIWAAVAAGMTPTPGSRKIVGRRPELP